MRHLLAALLVACTLGACTHSRPAAPATHGRLIAYTRVDGVVPGATTYRIRYTSRSVADKPIEVTGMAIVPDHGASNRVVLTVAHGTTGIADQCAPSRDPATAEARALGSTIVANNWILAATDYEGLGTPGRHPYLVGESEGRSVLDAALAAGQLPQAHAGNRTLIAGYSQGGHAALWANQLARTWAPTLRVLGTFAGAPATEIDRILGAGTTVAIQGFTLLLVAGYAAAYPTAQPATYLTPKGVSLLGAVDDGCLGHVFAVADRVPPDQLVRPDGPTNAQWLTLGRANNPGGVKGEGPVLIVHSDQDDVVPVELSALLHTRMCSAGQVVERRVIHAGGHTAAEFVAVEQAITWLQQRVTGQAAKDDC